MNIKSLLLGSAAAMVAVSSAHAADAVVVEPEPVEYVRVCDAYGSGFFFIPGTETCIRFSGFVRSAYEKVTFDGNSAGTAAAGGFDDRSFTLWGQRGRLNVDTRNETDWGTLRAVYRLEGGQSNVDTDIDMDAALISLAGFRAGFAGANYWSTNHGFGLVNAESVATNASGVIYPDGFYGFDDATIFDYTWAADGFSVTLGVEDTRISYAARGNTGGAAFGNATNNGGTQDGANFYAGFNWTVEGITIAGTAAHDTLAIDSANPTSSNGGWAYKGSVTLDISEFVPGGSVGGFYLYDGDYDTDYVHSNLLTENPEAIWGVAFQADLSDEVEFWVNYWDVEGSDNSLIAGAGVQTGDIQQFAVGLNWFPSAAPGFHIKATYFNGEIDNGVTPLNIVSGIAGDTGVNSDYDGFEISIRRDF